MPYARELDVTATANAVEICERPIIVHCSANGFQLLREHLSGGKLISSFSVRILWACFNLLSASMVGENDVLQLNK